MKHWFSASHEMFPPSELLAQAQAAAEAGFDGIGGSDHFAPWLPEGQPPELVNSVNGGLPLNQSQLAPVQKLLTPKAPPLFGNGTNSASE